MLPPTPAFYLKPRSLDELFHHTVARLLDLFDLDVALARWGEATHRNLWTIAPDYPGFGDSDYPDPDKFSYTFDKLAEVVERFLVKKRFDRYGLYVQDYGGPVGFRLVTKNPSAREWLIIQKTNAYEIGFTAAWGSLREGIFGRNGLRPRRPRSQVCSRLTQSWRFIYRDQPFPS